MSSFPCCSSHDFHTVILQEPSSDTFEKPRADQVVVHTKCWVSFDFHTWGFSIFQRWSFFHSLIWFSRVKRNIPRPLAFPTGFMIHTPWHRSGNEREAVHVQSIFNAANFAEIREIDVWTLTTSCKLRDPFGNFVRFWFWNHIITQVNQLYCDKKGDLLLLCQQ